VPFFIASGETGLVLRTLNRWWVDAWDYVSDGGWDSRLPFVLLTLGYGLAGAVLGGATGLARGDLPLGAVLGFLAGWLVAGVWCWVVVFRQPRASWRVDRHD
jgi:hypothetical protein